MAVQLLILLVASAWSLGAYIAPGATDIRGPCPFLQALANHGEINRDGTFNRDQLVNAANRVANMCKGLASVQFSALWIRDPSQAGLPGPQPNWEFNQSHMLLFAGGERDGGIAHTDKIYGNPVPFNQTMWNITKTFSSDGQTMGFWDLYKAHLYWIGASNKANNRTDPAQIDAHESVGVANVATLWMFFGQKPIPLADLQTLLSGRIPDNYVKPDKEWCIRDWFTFIFILKTGGTIPVDDLYIYLICKKATVGIPLPEALQCELDFAPYVPEIAPRSSAPSTWANDPVPIDPGTRVKAFKMGAEFPFTDADESCAMNETVLVASRLTALKQYFLINQQATDNYTDFELKLSPLFLDDPNTRIINNAAGIFSSIKIVVEYTALTLPPMNGGFAFFGPPTVHPETFQYFSNNATIVTDNTRIAAFVCNDLPIINPADGKVLSDGNCETPLIPAATTTMVTFVPCSNIIKQFLVAFDDQTEKMAVYGFNSFRTCWYQDKYCVGANQQYNSFEDCITFMNSVPHVSCSWLLQGNSQQCRGLHAFLAKLDPDVHCPHLGPKSTPCSDETCLANAGGSLLCDDYEPSDIRYDSKKSENCPPSESSSSILQPQILLLVVLSLTGLVQLVL